MESQVRYAKDLIKHNKIVKISNTLFQVDENSIKIQRKKGRTIYLCDCENSSLFADNNFCSHKFALITYLSNNDFLQRLQDLISQYENFKNIKANVSIDFFLNDLNDIRDKW